MAPHQSTAFYGLGIALLVGTSSDRISETSRYSGKGFYGLGIALLVGISSDKISETSR